MWEIDLSGDWGEYQELGGGDDESGYTPWVSAKIKAKDKVKAKVKLKDQAHFKVEGKV